jgi:CRP-like cAMP-binding protein
VPTDISVRTPTNAERPAALVAVRRLLGAALGFRDCTARTLDAMVDGGRLRILAKGELLSRRGERFDKLCFVAQGSLETSVLRRDGHRHLISYLQPGDIAGIVGLVDGLGSVHDLRGRVDGTGVLLVSGALLRTLRVLDPALGAAFELQLAFRSRLLYERLASDPSMPLEARLARLLTTLAGLYGLKRDDGVLVSMKISQFDLADWLGVSRQSINLAMHQLREEKLVQSRYSTITVTDPQGLTERALC